MTEEKKEKKKGVVVVIALGGKPPKSPEDTADPDTKKKAMKDAWGVLKGIVSDRDFDYITQSYGITQEGTPDEYAQAFEIWQKGGTRPLMDFLYNRK